MSTLVDIYGPERAVFLSSWVALAIADRVERGLLEGVQFTDTTLFERLITGGLEAGQELPTDEEFGHAVIAVCKAYPELNLTARGKAAAAFQIVQQGCGRG